MNKSDSAGRPDEIPCRKCGRLLPFDLEHFVSDRTKKWGVAKICRECNRLACRERRNADVDNVRRVERERYRNDPERQRQTKERARRYYEENSEAVRARVRRREIERNDAGLPRIKDPVKRELAKQRNKERCRTHREMHLDEMRRKERIRSRTRDRSEYHRAWTRANPDKVRASNLRRRDLLRKSANNFTLADIERLRTEQNGRCCYCGRLMEPKSSKSPLRETIDHKTAVSKGGGNGPENIGLACWECNMAKGTQSPGDFLSRLDRPVVRDHPMGILQAMTFGFPLAPIEKFDRAYYAARGRSLQEDAGSSD